MTGGSAGVLLIDGDDLVWRAALSVGGDAGRRSEAVTRDVDRALEAALRARLEALTARFPDRRPLAALGDGENWRRELWPPYKAARRRSRRPTLLPAARDVLSSLVPVKQVRGLEADDVLGLAATAAPGFDPADWADAEVAAPQDVVAQDEPRFCGALRAEARGAAAAGAGPWEIREAPRPPRAAPLIVSRDKDLRTLPGWVAAFHGAARRVSEPAAAAGHLRLALSGDASDGYPGCPGVGVRRAQALLPDDDAPITVLWSRVVAAYRRAGVSEQAALLNARLARVLRRGDMSGDGRPRLWEPPT